MSVGWARFTSSLFLPLVEGGSVMHLLVAGLLAACWGTIVAVWTVGAVQAARHGGPSRRRDREGRAAFVRLVIVCVLIVLVGVGFWHRLAYGPDWLRALGLVLLAASTLFTLWARFALGTLWSFDAELRHGHRLVTSGPYALSRHPIYTGLLGMLLGSSLAGGLGRFSFLFPLGLLLFVVKLRAEEQLLAGAFPAAYAAYRLRVPALLPGSRLLRRRRDGAQPAARRRAGR